MYCGLLSEHLPLIWLPAEYENTAQLRIPYNCHDITDEDAMATAFSLLAEGIVIHVTGKRKLARIIDTLCILFIKRSCTSTVISEDSEIATPSMNLLLATVEMLNSSFHEE
jgi:hypothetical protein